MLTALGLLLRLALHKLAAGIALAIKHWQFTLGVLAILAVGFAGFKYRAVSNERDFAVATLERYVDQARKDQEARQRENKIREELFAREQEETKAEHTATIEKLKESYNALLKNKDATIADAAALRDSLRRKLNEAYASARLPEGTDRPIRLAEIGQNCNTAGSGQTDADYINALEYACAITTADYNTLYDRCEAVNKIFGVPQT